MGVHPSDTLNEGVLCESCCGRQSIQRYTVLCSFGEDDESSQMHSELRVVWRNSLGYYASLFPTEDVLGHVIGQ